MWYVAMIFQHIVLNILSCLMGSGSGCVMYYVIHGGSSMMLPTSLNGISFLAFFLLSGPFGESEEDELCI